MGKGSLTFLTDEEIEKIKCTSTRILDDVGVVVSHDEARRMLENAGARVDHSTELVRIPDKIIENCLEKIPKRIVLAGRNPDKDVIIDPEIKKTYPRVASGCESYIDLQTNKYRKVVQTDVKDCAIIADALENIYMCAAPYYSDAGFNLSARDTRSFAIVQENSTKHILIQPNGVQNLNFCIKLSLVEAGSIDELKQRPRFSAHVSPTSPLHYSENTVSMILLAGKYGIPVSLCTVPICGAGAPVTLAGGLAIAVAEHLAAIVILQLSSPGAPIIFASRPVPLDMRRGTISTGAIETAMGGAASAQLGKKGFGWPVDVFGAPTDSFIPDGQCIVEKSFGITLNICAGADILSGSGTVEAANIMCPAQLVIDNEMLGMAMRTERGIEVNDETLGLDAIRRIGAGVGKSFLDDEHTLKHFRNEFYQPDILTRTSRETWEMNGEKTLYDNARERAIAILEEHKPPPLDESLVKELRAISESAEKEIAETTTTT